MRVISPTRIQLSATPGGAAIALGVPARPGQSHRIFPTDEAAVPHRDSPYLTPALDVAGSVVTLPYDLALGLGDAVVYTANGGAAIGGLVDGATYYVAPTGAHAFRLAATLCGADPLASGCGGGAPQLLALDGAVATGRAHSFVKQGAQPPGDPAQVTGIRVLTPRTGKIFGVAVVANNSDEILAIGASAAVAITAGIGVGGNVNVVTVDTDAFIGALAVVNGDNTGASAQQSVLVAAASAFRQLMVSAALGGGIAGVATSATVDIVTIDTDAVIGDGAIVRAARDVRVTAAGSENIIGAAAAVGAGVAGIAAAVATIVLDVHTYARTGQAVTIDAGSNVLLAASDDTDLTTVSGGIGVGFVGIGAGVAVVSASKDTRAFIGAGSTVDARALQPGAPLAGIPTGAVTTGGFPLGVQSGLAVLASSTQKVFGMAVSAGGGFVGVAGAVNVTLIRGTTIARIESTATQRTTINGNRAAGGAQSVSVTATDHTDAFTVGGGIGGGFVGVAGGIDIGVIDVSTAAGIGDRATVWASDDVVVQALTISKAQSYAVSVGGGVVGVGASVSVWTIGGSPTGSYNDGESDQDALSSGSGTPQDAAGGHAGGGGADGYQGILDGAIGGSSDKTTQRINPTLAGASASISGAAPNTDIVSREFSLPATPGGTSSSIGVGVTINTGDDIRVTAEARDTFFALAGSATGGLVAVGASVVVATLTSTVDAGIAAGSVLTAGGDISVRAGHAEDSSAIAFSGQIGLVAIAGQIIVLDSEARQNAHIDDGVERRQRRRHRRSRRGHDPPRRPALDRRRPRRGRRRRLDRHRRRDGRHARPHRGRHPRRARHGRRHRRHGRLRHPHPRLRVLRLRRHPGLGHRRRRRRHDLRPHARRVRRRRPGGGRHADRRGRHEHRGCRHAERADRRLHRRRELRPRDRLAHHDLPRRRRRLVRRDRRDPARGALAQPRRREHPRRIARRHHAHAAEPRGHDQRPHRGPLPRRRRGIRLDHRRGERAEPGDRHRLRRERLVPRRRAGRAGRRRSSPRPPRCAPSSTPA